MYKTLVSVWFKTEQSRSPLFRLTTTTKTVSTLILNFTKVRPMIGRKVSYDYDNAGLKDIYRIFL